MCEARGETRQRGVVEAQKRPGFQCIWEQPGTPLPVFCLSVLSSLSLLFYSPPSPPFLSFLLSPSSSFLPFIFSSPPRHIPASRI